MIVVLQYIFMLIMTLFNVYATREIDGTRAQVTTTVARQSRYHHHHLIRYQLRVLEDMQCVITCSSTYLESNMFFDFERSASPTLVTPRVYTTHVHVVLSDRTIQVHMIPRKRP